MTEFKGDKRTKAYAKWKAKYESKPAGLGDVVEKITKATGIKKVVESITDSCGCEERRLKWNKLYPMKMKNPLTEEEYMLIKGDVDSKKHKFTPEDQESYKQIFERVFERKIQCTPCSFKKTVYAELVKAINI
jgi:hypothetical protein